VNKKNQKNFALLRALAKALPKPAVNKNFLLLFFNKEALAFYVALFSIFIWHRSTFVTPRPTSIMTDRNGAFMAQLGGGAAGYGYWPVGAVPARVADAILALEDRRFWDHPGVDPVALLRAARSDVFSGRRVSGASTIAMQVARLQHPESRTLVHKICEAATALVMTARYGRQAVLQQYLTLVPFGENTHGIADAAAWYFDRPVADLSWGQIALLAAIPQSPSRYHLGNLNGLARAKIRARLALARLRQQNVIDQPTYAEALVDLVTLAPRQHPARAPSALHAILRIAALNHAAAPAERIHSTIDLGLQARITAIAQNRFASLAPYGAQQFAVIVADRASMDVLALAGSRDYGPQDDGEIDYAARWRSPGSTLKPFIFAQAMDRGAISPASILQDAPDSGTDVENADWRFLGPLLPEQALGNSRNVPAAALVRRDGLDESHYFLSQLGLTGADLPGSYYGLSIAIGSMPTQLDRLVAAYGTLANDGIWQNLRWYQEQSEPPARRLISLPTARSITLFLSDPMARLPSFARLGATEFPFPVAVKTGTSQGYRDAWAMEYTDQYVIGIWVGRPDGAPMEQLAGITSAALIGRDILMNLDATQTDGQNDTDFAPPPNTAPVNVCAATGAVPGHCAAELVEYLPDGESPTPAKQNPGRLRITSPLDHQSFILNPDAPPGLAVLPLHAEGGAGTAIEWYVDGQPYQMANEADTVNWPATAGRHVIEAHDPYNDTQSKLVVVEVQ
jgi:penicillin-binding protein 1C